jgi:hypothetical protein
LGVLTLLLCLAHALASPWDALISTGEGVVLVATPSTADAAIQEWIRRDLMRDLGRDGIALLTPEDHAAISASWSGGTFRSTMPPEVWMTRTSLLALALLTPSTAMATDYAELYFDGFFNDAQAREAGQEAGVHVEGLPAALPKTVSVAPVEIDFEDWQQASPGNLGAPLRAAVAEQIGQMLRLRLLREGFTVLEDGGEATVTLKLDLDDCTVPETRKSKRTLEAGTYPCVSAAGDRSGLKLTFEGEGWTSTIKKKPMPMRSGRQTVDRAIIGSDHDIAEVPSQPWLGLEVDEDTDYDVTMVLNLGDKVLGHAFGVWGAATRELRKEAGLVRRVDEVHPLPPLHGSVGCFVATITGPTARETGEIGLRLAYHPEDSQIVMDEVATSASGFERRALSYWTVEGSTAAVRTHDLAALESTMTLEGEPWAWTGFKIAVIADWTKSIEKTDAGFEVVESTGPDDEDIGYTLQRVDDAGCSTLFERVAPPRDWPFWKVDPAPAGSEEAGSGDAAGEAGPE